MELELDDSRSRLSEAALSPPPVATQMRDTLVALLGQYETSRGISRDQYSDEPQWHAMAEAQYLEAVTVAHTSGLWSRANSLKRVRDSVSRLENGVLRREVGEYAQWGLGFPWARFPANEVFLVTTALVTRALVAALDLVDCSRLTQEGLTGLARFPHADISFKGKMLSLPVYAPSMREPVDNTVALWTQALAVGEIVSKDARALPVAQLARSWLDSRYIPGVGWRYSSNRPVIDLLHQVYVMEGLWHPVEKSSIEDRAIEVFAGFNGPAGFIDSMELADLDAAVRLVERSASHRLVFRGRAVLLARVGNARLWSLGAMLGAFGIFAREGARKNYWLNAIRRFPIDLIPTNYGKDFRQEMHLARGIAIALSALRSSEEDKMRSKKIG